MRIVQVMAAVALLLGGINLAQAQGEGTYYPGKHVWAETSGGALHSKARVVGVEPNGDVKVAFFEHGRFETLESLLNMGQPVETRVISRATLDEWNVPRYEVLVPFSGQVETDKGSRSFNGLWPKARVVREVSPGQFEVEIFGWSGKPNTTTPATITVSLSDLLKYNAPRIANDGDVVDGIRWNPTDPDVQKAVGELRAIVDKYEPQIRQAPSAERALDLQRELVWELGVKYKSFGIEHDGNLVPADKPTASERRAMASKDPAPGTVGSYLRSKVGVCNEQAAVWSMLLNASGANRVGVFGTPYSTVHGETRIQGFAKGADGRVRLWNMNHDLTASRAGTPVPNRGFEPPSTSMWKVWEVQMQKGEVGLGYSRGLHLSRPFRPGTDVIPEGFYIADPTRVPVDLKGAKYSRAGSVARQEALLAGQFVAAYLLKEALKAAETGDVEQMKAAAAQLGTARFWKDLGIFTVGARGTQMALAHYGAGKFAMSTLPLAAGMAAVQILSGQFSPRDIIIDTASYVSVGALVNAFADQVIFPVLFRGAPGVVGTFAYQVAKLAVTLFIGEKFGEWLRRSTFDSKRRLILGGSSSRREGAAQKVEGFVPTEK